MIALPERLYIFLNANHLPFTFLRAALKRIIIDSSHNERDRLTQIKKEKASRALLENIPQLQAANVVPL